MNIFAIRSDNRITDTRYGLRRLAALCLLVAAIVSCGACTTDTLRWTEELQLSDGRVIQVARYERNEVGGGIGGPVSALPLETRLKIRSVPGATTQWVDQREPVFLDIDPATGEFVLICTTGDQSVWWRRGQPDPPYWQFRLTGGTWQQEPMQEKFFGLATNLVIHTYRADDVTGLVTLKTKQDFWGKYGAVKRYRTINKTSRFGID